MITSAEQTPVGWIVSPFLWLLALLLSQVAFRFGLLTLSGNFAVAGYLLALFSPAITGFAILRVRNISQADPSRRAGFLYWLPIALLATIIGFLLGVVGCAGHPPIPFKTR